MGAHLKLGRPLMVEVHGSEDPLKFDDLDEVCHGRCGTSLHSEQPETVDAAVRDLAWPAGLLWFGLSGHPAFLHHRGSWTHGEPEQCISFLWFAVA